jgi:hypothetical protein
MPEKAKVCSTSEEPLKPPLIKAISSPTVNKGMTRYWPVKSDRYGGSAVRPSVTAVRVVGSRLAITGFNSQATINMKPVRIKSPYPQVTVFGFAIFSPLKTATN